MALRDARAGFARRVGRQAEELVEARIVGAWLAGHEEARRLSPRTSLGRMRLDHVQLAAPPGCEEAARLLRRAAACLSLKPRPDAERRRLVLARRAGAARRRRGGRPPAGKAHPGLAVDGDAELDAPPRGSRPPGRPGRVGRPSSGVRRFHTADPWGNRVELLAP